jgi:hypothetical protein
MLAVDFFEHFPRLAVETLRFHTNPIALDKTITSASDVAAWKKIVTPFLVTIIVVNLLVKWMTGQSIIIVPAEHWSRTQITVNGTPVDDKKPAIRQVRFLNDAGGNFYFAIGTRFGNYVSIPVKEGEEAPCTLFQDRRVSTRTKSVGGNISGGTFHTLGNRSEEEKASKDDIGTLEFAELVTRTPGEGLSAAYTERLGSLLSDACGGSFAYYIALSDLDAMGYSDDLKYLYEPQFFLSPFNVPDKVGSIAASVSQFDFGALNIEFARLDSAKISTVVVVICLLSIYLCLAVALVISGWVPRNRSFLDACAVSFKLLTYISVPALLFVGLLRIAAHLFSLSDAQQTFWLQLGAALLIASSLRSLYEINRKLGMNARKFFVSVLIFAVAAQTLVIIVAAPIVTLSILHHNWVSQIP